MSWLEKLLPPKIQQTDPSERRTVPEGLWIKCPSCETVLYKTDLEQNINVCPKCAHHHRIGARARLDAFLDPEGIDISMILHPPPRLPPQWSSPARSCDKLGKQRCNPTPQRARKSQKLHNRKSKDTACQITFADR